MCTVPRLRANHSKKVGVQRAGQGRINGFAEELLMLPQALHPSCQSSCRETARSDALFPGSEVLKRFRNGQWLSVPFEALRPFVNVFGTERSWGLLIILIVILLHGGFENIG